MAVTEEFRNAWLECEQEYGKNIEEGDVQVIGYDEVDETISLPAVKFTAPYSPESTNVFECYAHVPMATFKGKIDDLAGSVNTAISDLADIKRETAAAAEAASEAKDAANDAAESASRVNIVIDGSTVTITDRYGASSSVSVSFEIYKTYPSVAAMNADAVNVPTGKLVIIATNDPVDPDNAKLYCKNARGSFDFLSNLGQASTEAWADWLENMKPQITEAIAAANDAAGRVDSVIATANQDHTTAQADHTTAQSDHTTAQADHTNYTADRQTFTTNEAARQRTFETNETQRGSTFNSNEQSRQSSFNTAQATRNTTWTDWFSDSAATGVRKLWNDFWTSINNSWNGFFGTSADDANGVRKIWSNWFTAVQSAWNGFFGTSADDANGVRKIWSNWFTQAQSNYTSAEANRNSQYQTAEQGRGSQYTSAEANRQSAFTTAEANRQRTFTTAEGTRQDTFEDNEEQRDQDFDTSETARQQTFETNETQRQQAFEDAESDRVSAMLMTRLFVDTTTMCLMVVQPVNDTTVYAVRNGNLEITFQYEE